MNKLKLAPDLSFPLEVVTRRLAILAMSGAGKSNVAVVMAEQMHDAGIPWVAIDPKGDWWGVRSSEDGKGAGLPIPIFGGLHGDIPLEPTSGKMIADLIIDQRLTCVLDISEFERRQEMFGFLIDLGETLLRRNRQALHIFLEEADEYLPQRTTEKGNLPRCLGVWQRVIKKGRFRGIGSTQITQRNASLNKDTLYMAEALIAMRVGGKADREAVRGWVDYHAASSEIVNSLPTLADGEGWVSSPAWLKLTERVKFDRRRTFDSGATPVHLKGTTAPATLADVDLEKLRVKMAATIEKAKADDPAELRKEIAALRRQLREPTRDGKTIVTHETMVSQIDAAVNAANREKDREIAKLRKQYSDFATLLHNRIGRLEAALPEMLVATSAAILDCRQDAPVLSAPRRPVAHQAEPTTVGALPVSARVEYSESRGGGSAKGKQRILDALAMLRSFGIDPASRAQVGVFAGYNLSGGSPAQYVGALIESGGIAIPRPGMLELTAAGARVAQQPEDIRSLDDLHRRAYDRLGPGERKILAYLISIYPHTASRLVAGETVGYSLSGGSPAQYVGKLITLDFATIPHPGSLRASDLLFPKGLR